MAFLTPFYLLAGLTVGLPILFHLIRRTPRGRQVFSSLMFLQSSPPKVTKRSRVEDWLLLMLRALAICLLALAFARPFLRTQDHLEGGTDLGRRIVVLIDTSASLQRTGYWEQSQRHVETILRNVNEADALSILTFDHKTRTVISFNEWLELEPGSRRAVLHEKLKELRPTYAGTELGRAIIETAELLEEKLEDQVQERKLYVVSDFQTGSHWESLNGYEWPTGVRLELLPVEIAEQPTNASLQLIASESTTDQKYHLRVNNTLQSNAELFQINWVDEFSEPNTNSRIGSNPLKVYVPPGQSKVILAPERDQSHVPQRLVLTGDQHDFDNICYVTRRDPWEVNIVFIGDDISAGPDSLRFFVEPVFPNSPARNVTIRDWRAEDEVPPVAEEKLTLLLIAGSLSEQQLTWSQTYLKQGGKILFIARTIEQAAELSRILALPHLPCSEASIVDYQMLRSVDLAHPVFAPFNEPRYADFSKLRFWKHRIFETASLPEHRVLATFEDASPAIFELKHEQGEIVVFAAGWNRSESELAVWSKFVPMMNSLLEYLGEQRHFRPMYYVGDRVSFVDFGFQEDELVLRLPSGAVVKLSKGDQLHLDEIGIYALATQEAELSAENVLRFAVNLPPDESKTEPISPELLAAAGLPLESKDGKQEPEMMNAESQRQLLNRELEAKQQLWKWILLAAILILLLESIVAGLRQRRSEPQVSVV